MHTLSEKLYTYSSRAVGFFLAVIVLMVTIQIVARNILQVSCVWSDEIARYAFIWLTAVGASTQVRDKGHFVIALFSDSLKNKKPLTLIIYALMFVTAVIMFIYGVKHVIVGAKTLSVAARIPMPFVYAAIPTGALCMIFYIIEMTLEELGLLSRPAEHPHEEGGGV